MNTKDGAAKKIVALFVRVDSKESSFSSRNASTTKLNSKISASLKGGLCLKSVKKIIYDAFREPVFLISDII
jgi:hypothetical protein